MYIPRDDEDSRRKLDVYRTYNSNYAKDDEDYYKNLYSIKPKLNTIEDCLEFYSLWFNIHRDVLKDWDNVSD